MPSIKSNRSIESNLNHILTNLLNATSDKPDKRFVTVRWFNRLYYDSRKWNEGFLHTLHTYPGFRTNPTIQDYETFIESVKSYEAGIGWRVYDYVRALEYGDVEADLCTNLQVLVKRFAVDFDWLKAENPELYNDVQEYLILARWTRRSFIGLASDVGYFISSLRFEEPNWHLKNSVQVVSKIQEYENASREELAKLHEFAKQVGISLLTISEYETALANEGSANPALIVMGEVTMGNKYVNKGQAGAFGENAQANNINFNLNSELFNGSLDIKALVVDLAQLRQAMKDNAQEPEHYNSLAEIAKAEKAIKEKNETKAIEAMKSAGKWALDTATSIGTNVAAEVIKKAMGLA